jgi:hypothetical protein
VDQAEIAKNAEIQMLAGEYGDLLSIRDDLAFVKAAAERYVVIQNKSQEDGTLQRALWGAAVVAYRRCFTTGKGHGLIKRSRLVIPQTVIDALEIDLQETHTAALFAADKHVAHRVSDLSQMPISLLFQNDASGGQEVAGLVVLGATYLGPMTDDAQKLSRLADQLHATTVSMAESKHGDILNLAARLLHDEPDEVH